MSDGIEFSAEAGERALRRQRGLCAFCGASLDTPWTEGEYVGKLHHLVPSHQGGSAGADNCVWLCLPHHTYLGHPDMPLGIFKQGGGVDPWTPLGPEDLPYWEGDRPP